MATLQATRQNGTARRAAVSKYPGLTRREAHALDRLRRELRAILPKGEIKSLYLYGSKPRGEANVHSDIDVFLVYDGVTPEQEHAVQELVVDRLGKPPGFHLLTYRAVEVERDNGASPLLYNISHHGILVEGTPMAKLKINRKQTALKNIADAMRKLRAAKYLLDGEMYPDSVSASYYAALYAADAALAAKGLVAQSHTGTETLITIHFIRPRIIPEEFKGLLGRARESRIQADYKRAIEFNREDAEYWLGRAEEFATIVEASLETWLAEPPVES